MKNIEYGHIAAEGPSPLEAEGSYTQATVKKHPLRKRYKYTAFQASVE